VSRFRLAGLLLAFAASQWAESGDEFFRVYTDPPRIFLRPQRLRLLKRERERQSERWQRFAMFASSPEPGFLNALHAVVSGEPVYARQAIEWASSPGSDPRQVAIVLDWCRSEMTPAERNAIVDRLRAFASSPGDGSVASARARVFAAVAISSDDPAAAENVLRDVVTNWWRKRTAPALASGTLVLPAPDHHALYELLHVIRDNLNIDLRENADVWFRALPEWHVLSHYPAPYAAPENKYYIPVYAGAGEPDLRGAALSRAAGLSIVAYDDNSQESQFLQGWLMQDSFALTTAFGAPYEFLWANPYLPGLSYHHMPKLFHDAASGRLALRSSWDDDATWLGKPGGELQLFSGGKTTILKAAAPRAPMEIGPYRVIFGEPPSPLSLAAGEVNAVVILGVSPGKSYSVQEAREHSYQAVADKTGTLVLEISAAGPAVVKVTAPGRVRKRAR
jgi:hypothetical protein